MVIWAIRSVLKLSDWELLNCFKWIFRVDPYNNFPKLSKICPKRSKRPNRGIALPPPQRLASLNSTQMTLQDQSVSNISVIHVENINVIEDPMRRVSLGSREFSVDNNNLQMGANNILQMELDGEALWMTVSLGDLRADEEELGARKVSQTARTV